MSNIRKSKKGVEEQAVKQDNADIAVEKASISAKDNVDTSDYDAILDEIDEMLTDEEQVHRYTQLSGQ